ncbi:hypothetical protein F4779DRAFT_84503 [Xylariaceae sp. FL0662B]|nr:hypothetical protein F4779DRAFT_84503 [Xylariaceae sp. FL0662B]
MKSTSIAAALLASAAAAQPHGHHRHLHPKRELVTEWDTVWETATVIVDESTTKTILPSAQSYEVAATPSSPTSVPAPLPVVESSPSPSIQTSYVANPTTPTTTSVAEPTTPVAPPPAPTTPTTQVAPPPPPPSTPTTTEAAPATSYPAAPPANSGGSGSDDGIKYNVKNSGDITYYTVGIGACGWDDTGADESENIVAIPHKFWDDISTATNLGLDQPVHPLCGKTITITGADGKTCTAKITDRCGGCEDFAIDVTSKVFTDLFGSLEGGRLEASWFINPS